MASDQRPGGLRQGPSSSSTTTSGILPQTHQPKSQLPLQTDTKPRGANRSTKIAGKLKVLPDQGDGSLTISVPVSTAKHAPGPPSQAPVVTISSSVARGITLGDQDDQHLPDALAPVREEEITVKSGGAERPESASDDEEGDGDIEEDDEVELEELDAEVYNQIAQIPEGTARRDAIRLTKKKAKSLPRVTAYATASSYRLHEMMRFFQARKAANRTNARVIDDVIYTPYAYDEPSATMSSSHHDPLNSRTEEAQSRGTATVGDLLGVPELHAAESGLSDTEVEDSRDQRQARQVDRTQSGGEELWNGLYRNLGEKKKRKRVHFDSGKGTEADVFVFEYGTIVIWGMSEIQEKRFLSSIKRFEVERLASEYVEMEDLNYYYANYSRIYNDVITLRRGSSHMTKLSLSHALAQSVKISVFEELISSTIENTKDIPEIISETGKVGMPHKEIMKQIGELFLLRTNINLVGSVLDSPEVFWSYPDLQPLYEAARSYLEIPQRVNLLNTRVEVLQDMLQLLKESVSSKHSERLEQIVIALIGIEIVLGVITILVDLFS